MLYYVLNFIISIGLFEVLTSLRLLKTSIPVLFLFWVIGNSISNSTLEKLCSEVNFVTPGGDLYLLNDYLLVGCFLTFLFYVIGVKQSTCFLLLTVS